MRKATTPPARDALHPQASAARQVATADGGIEAFALVAFLVILVFLVLRKDLKALKPLRIGRGGLIWLVILLAWFIPACVQGGREFFDIVVHNEMINRFLGAGTRAGKTRPFYYLVGHFLRGFLP